MGEKAHRGETSPHGAVWGGAALGRPKGAHLGAHHPLVRLGMWGLVPHGLATKGDTPLIPFI